MWFLYLQVICERSDVFASACAAARAFPQFSRKSSISSMRTVTVEFLLANESDAQVSNPCWVTGNKEKHDRFRTCVLQLSAQDLELLKDVADGVRRAARITDTPCAEMHTEAFLKVGKFLPCKPLVRLQAKARFCPLC